MDISYTFNMNNIDKADVENLFGCITAVMGLVKDSQTDEFEMRHLRDQVKELETKVYDLERENKNLKLTAAPASVSFETAPKKAAKKDDFKEV